MTNEQIEKYFNGLCTPVEASAVEDFLAKHPEYPFLLEDWISADGLSPLPGNYTQQMFDAVTDAITPQIKKSPRFSWKPVAAAGFAGMLAITAFFVFRSNKIIKPVAQPKPQTDNTWVTQRNAGSNTMELVLEDGSVIIMSPHTAVRYRRNFNAFSKREVFMTGVANFSVSKNKAQPFVVYTKQISTTVLGTTFSISAPENEQRIAVKLFEGHVQVALTPATDKTGSEFDLLPGEEFDFNSLTGKTSLHSFLVKNRKTVVGQKMAKAVDSADAGASYMFNNQTLADVLDQLSVMYHTPIHYSTPNIAHIYFIGQVDKDDSLEKIIHDIAVLNKLSVTKDNGGYTIKKK